MFNSILFKCRAIKHILSKYNNNTNQYAERKILKQKPVEESESGAVHVFHLGSDAIVFTVVYIHK
jgi:hypothetical protein